MITLVWILSIIAVYIYNIMGLSSVNSSRVTCSQTGQKLLLVMPSAIGSSHSRKSVQVTRGLLILKPNESQFLIYQITSYVAINNLQLFTHECLIIAYWSVLTAWFNNTNITLTFPQNLFSTGDLYLLAPLKIAYGNWSNCLWSRNISYTIYSLHMNMFVCLIMTIYLIWH